MKIEYFKYSWNLFDFALVVLGIIGCVFTILALNKSSDEREDLGSSETRIVRVAQVFRMLRFCRIFRMWRLSLMMHLKLTNKAQLDDLAEVMMKTSLLNCFIRAHIWSQQTMVRYFGLH